MDKIFNKEDVLTGITADQAVVGTKGYFGSGLRTIAYNVERNDVHRLCAVNEDETSCFTDEEGLDYLFFLPADRVKNKVKEPVYRPIKTIDELYNFLVSSVVVIDFNNTIDKVGVIFSSVFELKGKNSGYTYFRKFSRIYSTNNAIVLDDCSLEYYFQNYEIKQNGEFVPFGIKDE